MSALANDRLPTGGLKRIPKHRYGWRPDKLLASISAPVFKADLNRGIIDPFSSYQSPPATTATSASATS